MTPDTKMDAAFLEALGQGEIFESEGLFLGVSQEPVRWTVLGIKEGKEKKIEMEAKYFGARLGNYRATIKKSGDVKFEELKEAK